jgi:hypothetical protein
MVGIASQYNNRLSPAFKFAQKVFGVLPQSVLERLIAREYRMQPFLVVPAVLEVAPALAAQLGISGAVNGRGGALFQGPVQRRAEELEYFTHHAPTAGQA